MEAIVFCGVQASGKSTFYVERYLDTHVRISQDLLRTRRRMARMLDLCLETRQPFVVDRVNATPDQRAVFAGPAKAAGFQLVACWFDAAPADALARNARRGDRARVPVTAILGTHKRLVVPRREEGFDAVWRVAIGAGGFEVTPLPGPADAP